MKKKSFLPSRAEIRTPTEEKEEEEKKRERKRRESRGGKRRGELARLRRRGGRDGRGWEEGGVG